MLLLVFVHFTGERIGGNVLLACFHSSTVVCGLYVVNGIPHCYNGVRPGCTLARTPLAGGQAGATGPYYGFGWTSSSTLTT